VIASMTRSNVANDIGFMKELERLNVLLSRARNALIMMGNSTTFSNSQKGQILWQKFFTFIKDNGHFYTGLPVKCELHPTRTQLLRSEEDFVRVVPDGGCTEPW
jgi:hypothetical protein